MYPDKHYKVIRSIYLSVALALSFVVAFPAMGIAQKGNVITFRNNKFEMGPGGYDTIVFVDEATKEQTLHTTPKPPIPAKMNGKKVYRSVDFQATAYQQPGWNDIDLKEYLLSNLSAEFANLPDLKYKLSVANVVIDHQGKIVYFEDAGVVAPHSRGAKEFHLAKEVKAAFAKKMQQLLNNAPKRSPATIPGTGPVPYLLDNTAFMNSFTIKGHKLATE